MSEVNESEENTAGNRETGLNKYKKKDKEDEQSDAIASAD